MHKLKHARSLDKNAYFQSKHVWVVHLAMLAMDSDHILEGLRVKILCVTSVAMKIVRTAHTLNLEFGHFEVRKKIIAMYVLQDTSHQVNNALRFAKTTLIALDKKILDVVRTVIVITKEMLHAITSQLKSKYLII
jgi:hypothetical protein